MGESASRSKKKVYDPKEEAERRLYRDEKKKIYAPAEHILQSMVKAGTKFRFEGKKTFKDIILSGVAIEPECIPLNKKSYDEIDARPVVINRARVLAWRPRFNEWEVSFNLLILDDHNISIPIAKEILETAGPSASGIIDHDLVALCLLSSKNSVKEWYGVVGSGKLRPGSVGFGPAESGRVM